MSSPRPRLLIAAAALLVLIGSSAVVMVKFSPDGISDTQRLKVLERCLQGFNDLNGTRTTDEASVECVRGALGPTPDQETVFGLIRALFLAKTDNDFLGRYCHDAAHAIGTTAKDALGESAFTKGLEQCGFGYIHGLMLATASAGPVEEAFDRLGRFCNTYREPVLHSSNLDFCTHGIGHAIAERVEVPRAAELCSTLLTEDLTTEGENGTNWSSPSVSCFTGVLNEKLRYDYMERRGAADVETALVSCTGLAEDLLAACAQYTLHYSLVPLATIQQSCPTLQPKELISGCWEAVGFRGADSLSAQPGTSIGGDVSDFEGYDLDRFLESPLAGARFIDLLCDGDDSGFCQLRFSLVITQSTQRPEYITEVCEQIEAPRARYTCLHGARALSDETSQAMAS